MGPLKNSVKYVLNKCNFFKKKKDEHTVLPSHGQEGRHSFAGMQAALSRSWSLSHPVNIGEPSFHREGSTPPRRSFAEGSSRYIHGGIPSQARPKDYKSRAQQKRQDERDEREREKEELQYSDEDEKDRKLLKLDWAKQKREGRLKSKHQKFGLRSKKE